MKFNKPCELCMQPAQHKHHIFSNTKVNRKLYKGLLDKPFNIIYLCADCHLAGIIPKYTEIEFIEAGEKAGFRLSHLAGKTINFKLLQREKEGK